MKIQYIAILIVGLMNPSCNSTKKVTSSQANVDLLIRQNQYEQAKEALDKTVASNPTDGQSWLKLGRVNYLLHDKQAALIAFKKASESIQPTSTDANYGAGLTASELGKMDEAVTYMKAYLSTNENNPERINRAKLIAAQAERLFKFKQNSLNVDITALPSTINTPALEYLPMPTLNQKVLYFTRRINHQEYLFSTVKTGNEWLEAEREIEIPMSTIAFSADGNTIVYTECKPSKTIGSCDVFMAKLKDGQLQKVMNMGDVINSIKWDGQPTINGTADMIIFSSDRLGGKGGNDLYFTTKIDVEWQAPKPLSDVINSPDNEESPFLHPDGHTLYFRSDRADGLGSFDVYVSKYNDVNKAWSVPKNLGYPINTPANDGAFVVAADGVTAYLTSDRNSISSPKPHLDILTLQLPKGYDAIPTTYIAINVIDGVTKSPLQAKITVTNHEQNTKLIDQFIAAQTSKTIVPLPVANRYGVLVQAEGYQPYSNYIELDSTYNISQPYDISINLDRLKPNTTIVLKNILFQTNSAVLLPSSATDLDYIVNMMKTTTSRLKIIGHTDDVGTETDNLILSTNRAKSVYEYLVSKGILATRLSYEGKGESKPIASNDTAEGRAENRRTEFEIQP